MNDYLGQSRHDWAHQRRASMWPLVRLVLLAFLAGIVVGASIAFALSVLSSSMPANTPRLHFGPAVVPAAPASSRLSAADGGSTVRAGAVVGGAPSTGPSGDRRRGAPRSVDERSPMQTLSPRSAAVPARTTESLIRSAALRHGVDPDRLLRVARCESGPHLDVNAIGDGGRSIGVLQWQAATWLEYAKASGLGYTLKDWPDPEKQAELAAWAFSRGRSNAWTCAQ